MDAYDNVSSTTDPEELGKVHEGESDEDEQQDDVEFGSDDEILDLVGKPSDSVTAAPDSTKLEIKKPIPAEPLEEPRHQEKKEEMLKPVAGEVATPPAPLAPSSSCLDEKLFPSAPSEPLLHPFPVVDLLYWRDIKKTGIVFGASLFLLLSLTVCSIVSVISYLALALLSVTISFRIYKGVVQAIQKSDEGHPFKAYLESDVAVSEEFVHKYSDAALGRVNCALKELRHLFLVEDLVDSLKFAVLMWILTYVGALFNGLTLLILALISVFSIPVIYERHQAQIDHYLGLVNNQIKDIVAKIQAKVPGLKRKTE
ncbi:reticulon-1-A-like isoform X2 [Polypterus senegalus]|uniref:reticulon-1-A-like isoform X2 n=1 Tax=Polypterus senegalus TaxID=55291 RepID=UPI001962BEA9|nr:reticulon-1-A-like isoform X2 [Polypterus senegalus]